ncbi:MAG: DTW domain-containing protein [Bdellovibrionales bacterium]|nr:DTW domain-containing protein [Bdellovibrionales bacterium]
MPTRILILQHPREKKEPLATAPLMAEVLGERVILRAGLSWRNLAQALAGPSPKAPRPEVGADAESGVDPATAAEPVATAPAMVVPGVDAKRWGVLYLGSRSAGSRLPRPGEGSGEAAALYWVNQKEEFMPAIPDELRSLLGIVVIDGTWAQAKTLWWRNAWLLKLRRLVVVPARPSAYGNLRREPRPEALSSLESVAHVLSALGEPKAVTGALVEKLEALVASAPPAPKGAPGTRAAGAKKRRDRRPRWSRGARAKKKNA